MVGEGRGGQMTTGHNIEAGHTCPRCNAWQPCTVEDGYCAFVCGGHNLCDDCVRDDDAREWSALTPGQWEYRLEID